MPSARRCPACGALSEGPETHVCSEPATVAARPGAHGRTEPTAARIFGPKVGDLLDGRYEILEKVGEGGGGMVFRARDRHLDVQIAVKVLTPESVSDSMIKRFKREIRITRDIDHPNVSRVFDLGEADGLTFLTMRWIEGEPLHKRVRRRGPLGVRELHRLAASLVDALATTHRLGVVHRDVKPANVLVAETGEGVLVDFGIATENERSPGGGDRALRERITLDGHVPGTPAFMAPEQARGEGATPASDLFSLGLTLVFAATGEAYKPKDPLRASALARFVRPLRRLLAACLDEDPKRRPPSATRFQDDLARSVRRRRLLRTALVTVAVGAIAATTGFLLRPDDGAAPLVCVPPMENRTGDPDREWLERGLPDLLAARLETTGRVRIALDPASCERATRVEGRVSGSANVELRLRAPDGAVVARARFVASDGEALFQGVDLAVASFLGSLGIQSVPHVPAAALITGDPVAFEHFARGREFVRQHKDKEALDELRAATTRDPEFSLAQLERWVLIEYTQNAPLAEAAEALRQARAHADRLSPDDREFLEAAIDARGGRQDRLVAYLRGHPPASWRFHTGLRAFSGSPEERRRYLEEWIERLPADPEPHNQLGYVLWKVAVDLAAAEREFQTYIRLAPDLANAHDSYGDFLRSQGRLDEAARAFDRAVETDPTFANAAVSGVDVALRRNDLADADARVLRARGSVSPTVLQFVIWSQQYVAIPILAARPREAQRRLEEIAADPQVGSRAYVVREFEAVLAAISGDVPRATTAAAEAERLRMLYHGRTAGRSSLPAWVDALSANAHRDLAGLERSLAALRSIGTEGTAEGPVRREAEARAVVVEGMVLRLRGDPSAAAERFAASLGSQTGYSFVAGIERARALVAAERLAEAGAAYDELINRGQTTSSEPETVAELRACHREAAALFRRLGRAEEAAAIESRLAVSPDPSEPG